MWWLFWVVSQPPTSLFPSLWSSSVLGARDPTPRLPRWHSGKEPACERRRYKRCGFDPWVGKIPWRRKCQPTPAFLPGEFHGLRSLVGYSPWSHKRVRHDLATKPTSLPQDSLKNWIFQPFITGIIKDLTWLLEDKTPTTTRKYVIGIITLKYVTHLQDHFPLSESS